MTQVKIPSGNATSIPLRLCSRGAADDQLAFRCPRCGSAAPGWSSSPDRYRPVSERGVRHDLRRGSRARRPRRRASRRRGPGPRRSRPRRIVSSSCSTTSTVLPRSRSPPEGVEQPAVVALVQADRRFVEHVEHAHEPGADLGGQADALRLAARERAGGAVEREVVEPDCGHEPEPVGDLLEDLGGDCLLTRSEGKRPEPRHGLLDRELHHVVDGAVPDAHRERLAAQPLPAARRARTHGHEALDLRPRLVGGGLPVFALKVRTQAPRTARGTPSVSVPPRGNSSSRSRSRRESRCRADSGSVRQGV